MNGAIARIILRYGIGALAGMNVGSMVADDPDIQMFATMGVALASGLAVEWYYRLARKYGWPT